MRTKGKEAVGGLPSCTNFRFLPPKPLAGYCLAHSYLKSHGRGRNKVAFACRLLHCFHMVLVPQLPPIGPTIQMTWFPRIFHPLVYSIWICNFAALAVAVVPKSESGSGMCICMRLCVGICTCKCPGQRGRLVAELNLYLYVYSYLYLYL